MRFANVRHRELTFASRGVDLRGVLTIPATDSPRRLPGVLIVHDWGPMSRQGRVQGSLGIALPHEVTLYQDLAEALARRGVAVMRYDKRTCTAQAHARCTYPREHAAAEQATLADALLEDAQAALQTLARQPDVDSARLGVIGHGHGAEIALTLPRNRPQTSPPALVLLAPSAAPPDRQILYQTDFSIAAAQARLEDAPDDAVTDMIRRQLEALKAERDEQSATFTALRDGDLEPEALTFGLPAATWTGLLALHERALTTLRSPETQALILLGGLDASLPPDNPQRLEQLLGRPSPRRHIELLDETTHNLILLEDDAQAPPRLAPRVIDLIAAHLLEAP